MKGVYLSLLRVNMRVFNMFLICFAIDVAHERVSHRTSLNRVSIVYNDVPFLTECLQSSYNIYM